MKKCTAIMRVVCMASLLLTCGACESEPPVSRGAVPATNRRAGFVALALGGEQFEVAVAASDETRRLGLSGRATLGRNEGLLFLYRAAAPRSFWMKDCLIALDIIYMNAEGRILNVVTMSAPAPGTVELDLPLAHSLGSAIAVLEVSAGTAQRLNLKPGDVIRWSAFGGSVQ